MEEKKTLGGWATSQNIKLLDTKYYDDEKLYTLKEYSEIVPRNIEVPLNSSNEVGSMEELLKELQDLKIKQDSLKQKESEIKEKLEAEFLTDKGYKTDYLTISYSKPSTSTSIDLAKLQEKEPDLYNDLLKDYPKISTRRGSFSYKFNKV